MRAPAGSRRAFTLLNVVVGLVLLIVLVGIILKSLYFFRVFSQGEQWRAEAAGALELALRAIEREVRSANDYVPLDENGELAGKPRRGRIVIRDRGHITFRVYRGRSADGGGSVSSPTGEEKYLRCSIGCEAGKVVFDFVSDKGRTGSRVIARNISSLAFSKGDGPRLLSVLVSSFPRPGKGARRVISRERVISANVSIAGDAKVGE